VCGLLNRKRVYDALYIHRFAKIPPFALCGYAGCIKINFVVMIPDSSFAFQWSLFRCEILVLQRVMVMVMMRRSTAIHELSFMFKACSNLPRLNVFNHHLGFSNSAVFSE
jgi:hypothetical protein